MAVRVLLLLMQMSLEPSPCQPLVPVEPTLQPSLAALATCRFAFV